MIAGPNSFAKPYRGRASCGSDFDISRVELAFVQVYKDALGAERTDRSG